jgi:hypothetical protein
MHLICPRITKLDLPDEPLFKDQVNVHPQVPLFTLLEKYNGETTQVTLSLLTLVFNVVNFWMYVSTLVTCPRRDSTSVLTFTR